MNTLKEVVRPLFYTFIFSAVHDIIKKTMFIKDIPQFLEQEVALKGWVFNWRSSGSIYFLQLRDGTGRLQCVISKKDVPEMVWNSAQRLTLESSVIVSGRVYEEKRSPTGYEMAVKNLEIAQIGEEYPIGKKEHGIDFLLDYRHLWLRSPKQEAILRLRNKVIKTLRQFFDEQGFILTDTPILTAAAAEGTTNLFSVEYEEQKIFLAQTGQLYLEATSAVLSRTYCFGPTFRAEKSKTRRHLMEFWMLEAEASFMDWQENMELQEKMARYLVEKILNEAGEELKVLERDTEKLKRVLQPQQFPRLTYDEAIKKLRELGSDIQYGQDLGNDDETILTQQFEQPIFIHHYPAAIKAFYMKPDANDARCALNNDLLAPEGYGEIVGGSQRIDDLQLLKQRMQEYKLSEEDMGWYLDLRRYGSVPHSGFGIGLERTIAWLAGLEHVREAIPFPRMLYRMKP